MIDSQGFREAALVAIDQQEDLYQRQLRSADRCRKVGRAAALAPLVAAGVLMGHSQIEEDNLGVRLLTDIAALSTGALIGFIGEAQRDERKLKASDVAAKAINISAVAGFDPPSWAHQGVRIRTTLYPNNSR